jgi:hypothetical protein
MKHLHAASSQFMAAATEIQRETSAAGLSIFCRTIGVWRQTATIVVSSELDRCSERFKNMAFRSVSRACIRDL